MEREARMPVEEFERIERAAPETVWLMVGLGTDGMVVVLSPPDYIWNMGEKMKFSVSLDAELGQALREVAEEERQQISTVVSHALSEYLDWQRIRRDGLRAVEEYEKEFGTFTEEESIEAEAWVADLMGWEEEGRRSA
ncbi:hypothetical protein ACG5V6_02830 [Streptomyces chitinivorans]|uniref:CopG family transcriptional regulator n=1 Tax=Streptomyces chitinivorans TaxID=1257027 RepID=A0ABW7HMS6_9ACTN|nr:hypothetical protein [Streptomyces chitinivorans]MDH2408380.1 hypothetical protein [Streptomyces chitinivorans]